MDQVFQHMAKVSAKLINLDGKSDILAAKGGPRASGPMGLWSLGPTGLAPKHPCPSIFTGPCRPEAYRLRAVFRRPGVVFRLRAIERL